jgi:rSAM/selenodomain-associated transferase 1
MTRTLVIFAKAPALGRVKTRLARGIGQAAALAFYREALSTTLDRVAREAKWKTILAVTPDATSRVSRLWPLRVRRRGQGEGDLGARMGRAFRDFPKGKVVIVGADIPEMRADHIARAFAALGSADLVFGPAKDGGYWLIGAKGAARNARMFANVRWSTKHALADTLANLDRWTVALLDPLDDVDDLAAYRRFRRRGGFRPSPSASR